MEGLANDIHSQGDSWKKLARRLGIDKSKITAIDEEDKEMSKKAYSMLLHWKQKNAGAATYEVLFEGLAHKFVGRRDLAEYYCCE